jgi:uncharacterized protein (TIGR02996 family)
LRAIRENPEDDGLRLVFADWLEEQGDPLAEFIRLQCQLEPIRDRYGDPQAEELRRREEEMLEQQRDVWLGPLKQLASQPYLFQPTFRRGLVEGVWVHTEAFLDHADDLARWCPVLQTITLHDIRGRGMDLADAVGLRIAKHLSLDDWLTGEDAQALASCSHLAQLESLQIWLGGAQEEEVCRILARPLSLPGLRQLTLVQLLGGLSAGARATELSERANQLAELVDHLKGQGNARVCRPFERLFPIRESGGYYLHAGKLPHDRHALVAFTDDLELLIAVFDTPGRLVEQHRRNVGQILGHPEELPNYLNLEFGFEPSLIHVKEFTTGEGLSVYQLPTHYAELASNPDAPPEYLTGEVRGVTSQLSAWLKRGDYVIDWWNDYWVGPDGLIHST